MPGSINAASGQGQVTDVKVSPESGDDGQCSSMKRRESARNEIHQIANLVISSICGGPGWRRVVLCPY